MEKLFPPQITASYERDTTDFHLFSIWVWEMWPIEGDRGCVNGSGQWKGPLNCFGHFFFFFFCQDSYFSLSLYLTGSSTEASYSWSHTHERTPQPMIWWKNKIKVFLRSYWLSILWVDTTKRKQVAESFIDHNGFSFIGTSPFWSIKP